MSALSFPLRADPPTFRIFDLGVLPGTGASRAFGLNDEGAVVGQSHNKAFVWLFEPMYGYSTSFTMTQLASDAAANDINNAGIAVGRKPDAGTEIAHRWELVNGDVDEFSLGTLTEEGGERSEAFAINDASDAVIVGESGYHTEEECGIVAAGFRWDSINGMKLLGTVGQLYGARAFGVNNASPAVAAGSRTTLDDCDSLSIGCYGYADGHAWEGTAALGFLSVFQPFPVDMLHKTHDVNDQENFVGLGTIDGDLGTSLIECVRQAAFWASIAADPVVLNADSASDEAHANAITNLDACGMIRVVGQNSTSEDALYWEHNGTSWTTVLLEDQLLNTCFMDKLFEATDINEKGWIVGYADINPSGAVTRRAFLLLPMVESCYADLNGDCKVNGFDLAILLGEQNDPICATRTCWGDLDCSNGPDPDDTVGDVDSYDLAILLGEWTGNNLCSEDCVEGWGTCGGGGESAQSSASSEDEGTNPTLIAQLIGQLIGLGEIEAAAQLAELTGSE